MIERHLQDQKGLQLAIQSELESLTFNELAQLAMSINDFYAKSNGRPTIVINVFDYKKSA